MGSPKTVGPVGVNPFFFRLVPTSSFPCVSWKPRCFSRDGGWNSTRFWWPWGSWLSLRAILPLRSYNGPQPWKRLKGPSRIYLRGYVKNGGGVIKGIIVTRCFWWKVGWLCCWSFCKIFQEKRRERIQQCTWSRRVPGDSKWPIFVFGNCIISKSGSFSKAAIGNRTFETWQKRKQCQQSWVLLQLLRVQSSCFFTNLFQSQMIKKHKKPWKTHLKWQNI